MTDRALMEIDADILFTYDARGRMARTNELESRPAPRLFLGRTREGHVVRIGEQTPDGVAGQLLEVIKRQPPVDGLRVPPDLRRALCAILARDGLIGAEGGGPAYRFPEALQPPGAAVRVTDANREAVRDTFPWLYRELGGWGICCAVRVDGAAVAVCFSSRIGELAMEAGVFTLPAFRGRGYAASATAAWADAVRESGRIPLYSTSWENLASQGVARRLGLLSYGANASWG